MMTLRRSEERGLTEKKGFSSRHSFAFGKYFDENHLGVGDLRVINEDQLHAGKGFPHHVHRDMEVMTYVVSGELEHKDSLGNTAVLTPGMIQRLSAGSGIHHSGHNPLKDEETHFFQIWILPDTDNLTPAYARKDFSKDMESGKLVLALSEDGREGSISIHQNINLSLAKLKAGIRIEMKPHWDRQAWLQLISGGLKVDDQIISPGDGLNIRELGSFSLEVLEDAHFLYFDLPA